MSREVVLAGACRTAIGKFGGSLANIPVEQLGTIVIKEALNRAGVKPAFPCQGKKKSKRNGKILRNGSDATISLF